MCLSAQQDASWRNSTIYPKGVYVKISSRFQKDFFACCLKLFQGQFTCVRKIEKILLKKKNWYFIYLVPLKGNLNAFVGKFSALVFGLKATTGFPPSKSRFLKAWLIDLRRRENGFVRSSLPLRLSAPTHKTKKKNEQGFFLSSTFFEGNVRTCSFSYFFSLKVFSLSLSFHLQYGSISVFFLLRRREKKVEMEKWLQLLGKEKFFSPFVFSSFYEQNRLFFPE